MRDSSVDSVGVPLDRDAIVDAVWEEELWADVAVRRFVCENEAVFTVTRGVNDSDPLRLCDRQNSVAEPVRLRDALERCTGVCDGVLVDNIVDVEDMEIVELVAEEWLDALGVLVPVFVAVDMEERVAVGEVERDLLCDVDSALSDAEALLSEAIAVVFALAVEVAEGVSVRLAPHGISKTAERKASEAYPKTQTG